jgi:glycerophosphoryl diester phosphodiesterase
MASFERARIEGARAIELDVRASADGDAVVFHDPTLSRMTATRDERRIADVATTELGTLKLGESAARIPRLAEVLAWARDHAVAVNVELKHDVPSRGEIARAAARAVRASGADVLFSSFDPRLLAWVAWLSPSVPRAFLTHATGRTKPRAEQGLSPRAEREARRDARRDAVASAVRGILRGPFTRAARTLHLEQVEATAPAIARYRERGLRVGVWTVNDPATAIRLVGWGVASIITDSPGAILEALRGPEALPERENR